MKKLIGSTFAFFIVAMSFAQKSELKTAEKAIKNGNFADAKTAIKAAESLITSADDKLKAKFYFLKGKALYAEGNGSDTDVDMAVESFNALLDMNNSASSKYATNVSNIKTGMINNFLTKANNDLQTKNFAASSKGFEKAYKLSPSDTLYLYYAASMAVNGQDYDTALKHYNALNDMGYEGIEEQFVAISKESGDEEVFNDKLTRDLSVKAGTHIKPSIKKTEARSAEIIKNIALIYISKDDNEKAIAAMEKARKANPDDINLLLSEANVRYKMGDTASYKKLITEAAEKDPNNAELLYNLGVTTGDTDPAAAKTYYEKALQIDPEFVNAHINMAALILSGENAIVEEMNGLGSSAADDRKYDELKAKRTQLYNDAVPYLLSALKIKPNNVDAAKTLMNIYSALGDTVKYKEMRAKVDSLESGN